MSLKGKVKRFGAKILCKLLFMIDAVLKSEINTEKNGLRRSSSSLLD